MATVTRISQWPTARARSCCCRTPRRPAPSPIPCRSETDPDKNKNAPGGKPGAFSISVSFVVFLDASAGRVSSRIEAGDHRATIVGGIAGLSTTAGGIEPSLTRGPAMALVPVVRHLLIALPVARVDVEIRIAPAARGRRDRATRLRSLIARRRRRLGRDVAVVVRAIRVVEAVRIVVRHAVPPVGRIAEGQHGQEPREARIEPAARPECAAPVTTTPGTAGVEAAAARIKDVSTRIAARGESGAVVWGSTEVMHARGVTTATVAIASPARVAAGEAVTEVVRRAGEMATATVVPPATEETAATEVATTAEVAAAAEVTAAAATEVAAATTAPVTTAAAVLRIAQGGHPRYGKAEQQRAEGSDQRSYVQCFHSLHLSCNFRPRKAFSEVSPLLD